ncbi:MAG TPA: PfkB family carbohydrate kinase, partial [Anaerolineales bacterium]
ESLQPDIPQLFRTAHSLGLSVSLDTNYDPARRWDGGLDEALQLADVFLPNETEALAITHAPHLKAALAFLPENLCVAVKLGAQGALARCRGKMARVETFPIRVIDTTGAGDSFDAGFIFGYLAGWDLEKTLRLACACGALSTRASGGVAAQATLTEALEAR